MTNDELVSLLEEGWELLGEIASGGYVVRRKKSDEFPN
jgi:hypothetical protein